MGYLMFYIGYEDINTARICVARSKDGIRGWERSPLNPLIEPTAGSWDSEATYKPTVVWNEKDGKWMLWYNGRTENREYMGYAYRNGRDLFPKM
jgi:sucrose-6-phosphate hydrolase SacC (GH32 family)